VNGTELVFKRPGDDSEDEEGPIPAAAVEDAQDGTQAEALSSIAVVDEKARINIHED
jgi:hypothetical protein